MNSMICIKDKSVLNSLLLVEYDETLVEIISWLAGEYPEAVVFTCGYRHGDKGVHGTIPCRAVDIRSWTFKRPDRVCNYVNFEWEYDSDRPEMKVAIYHDAGSGFHIHLQSHPNTRKRT